MPRRSGRDGFPRVLPYGDGHPPAPGEADAQVLPTPPERHLPVRRVLRGERAAHVLCGGGSLRRQMAAGHWGGYQQVGYKERSALSLSAERPD